MRRDFPREPFLLSTVSVKGKAEGNLWDFWVINVGICKQARQQWFVFLVFINL